MTNNKIIKTTATISVNKNADTVFDFFANPGNDKLWRTEINESSVNGALQLGVTVMEYSYLSKKANNNLIVLQCVQFDRNKIAIFETLDNAQFYLKSERQVKAIDHSKTEITYTLDFDKDIVKFALGFSLPKFIISIKAKKDMKRYLQLLKDKIENDLQNTHYT